MPLTPLAEDDVPESDDVAPLRCEVDGCENTLIYSGRGRKPKFCDEHKRTVSSSGTGVQRANWKESDQVYNVLLKYLNGLGVAVTWVNPKDGKVIARGNPAVARALVNLGKQDKQWRKYLTRICQPGKYGELAFALTPVIIGIMANHNLLPQFVIPTIQGEGDSPND